MSQKQKSRVRRNTQAETNAQPGTSRETTTSFDVFSWWKSGSSYIFKELALAGLIALCSTKFFYVSLAGCWPNKGGWAFIIIATIALGAAQYLSPSKTKLRRVLAFVFSVFIALVLTLFGARAYLCSNVGYDSRQILRRVLQDQPVHDGYLFTLQSFQTTNASSSVTRNHILFHISQTHGYEPWIYGATPKDNQRTLFAINNLLGNGFIEAHGEPETCEFKKGQSLKIQTYRITSKGIDFHQKFTWGESSFLRDVIQKEVYRSIEGEDREMSRLSKTPMLVRPNGGEPVEGAIPQPWPTFRLD